MNGQRCYIGLFVQDDNDAERKGCHAVSAATAKELNLGVSSSAESDASSSGPSSASASMSSTGFSASSGSHVEDS